jgi:sec-independent protein translocase protein TatB
MLDFSFGKLAIIFALCLIVLGPEKLPKLAQQLGRFAGQARAMARHLRTQLEQEIAAEELTKQKRELEQAVQSSVDSVSSPITTVKESVDEAAHEIGAVDFPSANDSGHVDYGTIAPPAENTAATESAKPQA